MAKPARQVWRATPEVTTVATNRFEGDWPIKAESRTNAAVNPVIEAQVNAPSTSAGCSNIVTPVPHYVPRLFDLEWITGAIAIIKALIDPGDAIKRKNETFVETVRQTIDMDNYLPTSYDDMSSWRTIVGNLSQGAVA